MLVLMWFLCMYAFVHRCAVGSSRIMETQNVIFKVWVLAGEVVTLFILGLLIVGLTGAIDTKYKSKESPSPHSQIWVRPDDKPIRW